MAENAGSAKIPSKIKKLRGTWRKDRDEEHEPEPTVVRGLEAPDELKGNEIALAEWEIVTGELIALEMLTRVDVAMLKMYCIEVSKYFSAKEQVDSIGEVITYRDRDGNMKKVQKNPYLVIMNDALKNVITMAAQFGFSPSARTRINRLASVSSPSNISKNGDDYDFTDAEILGTDD